ncbi:MAG: efflux transporter outer membrane subunit [Gammaproteobacteria bacterium]|nr:efflux transporter outer membrane subunit [Gammaproteobacteria bacterium]
MLSTFREKALILLRLSALFALAGAGSGCAQTAVSKAAADVAMPDTWARDGSDGGIVDNWLRDFNDPQLERLVAEAIDKNYQLREERARLAQAAQAVIATRADRFPALDLSLGASRSGAEGGDDTRVTSRSYDASLGLFWEADLWGRLSATQQTAQLELQAQRARVQLAERELAASTAKSLFAVMQAKQLLDVAKRRLDNVKQSEEIVASGYRQGLNDALDLYLARNQVERQHANLAQQEQLVLEAVADLQLTLARYPDGQMQVGGELPVLANAIPSGLPSDLLLRRADLQEAWLSLLAADANLAAAHKARFPRLVLLGSGGVASPGFADLLDGEGSTWSLIGNLSQPVFQGGRLAAQEQIAAEQVREAEQRYLDLVYRAFADVENAISRMLSLNERYRSFLDAERNASAALTLALDQYQRGLVTYTTVLESQRQFFDAEETVVELRNQLLQNRIDLYLALGGEFAASL